MFQFLIGRLKTADACRGTRAEVVFQFLIGRLKTSDETLVSHSVRVCFNSS